MKQHFYIGIWRRERQLKNFFGFSFQITIKTQDISNCTAINMVNNILHRELNNLHTFNMSHFSFLWLNIINCLDK